MKGTRRLLVTMALAFALAVGLILVGADGWIQVVGTVLGLLVIWRYTGALDELRPSALKAEHARLKAEERLRRERENVNGHDNH